MTAGGAWRRPRMKVYDYNQEFGGNYYQVSQIYSFHEVYIISKEFEILPFGPLLFPFIIGR